MGLLVKTSNVDKYLQKRFCKAHAKFKAEVFVLSKEEGGRHTPFFANYRPQFYFRTTDVTGIIQLPEGTEMVMPGDNVEMTIELIAPIAIEEELNSLFVKVDVQ